MKGKVCSLSLRPGSSWFVWQNRISATKFSLLQVLEAIEEDLKRRSAVKTAKYVGPLVRMRSRQVDGAALVRLCVFV